MLPICFTSGINEAGTDEAGRGCLAGPVFAAAVILPEDFSNEYINDSKKLTERRRELLRPIIEEQALAWAVGIVNGQEIKNLNLRFYIKLPVFNWIWEIQKELFFRWIMLFLWMEIMLKQDF